MADTSPTHDPEYTMLNNLLNALALAVIAAIAASAAFEASAPAPSSKERAPIARAAASAPVEVVQLPTVEIVGHRDRTLATR